MSRVVLGSIPKKRRTGNRVVIGASPSNVSSNHYATDYQPPSGGPAHHNRIRPYASGPVIEGAPPGSRVTIGRIGPDRWASNDHTTAIWPNQWPHPKFGVLGSESSYDLFPSGGIPVGRISSSGRVVVGVIPLILLAAKPLVSLATTAVVNEATRQAAGEGPSPTFQRVVNTAEDARAILKPRRRRDLDVIDVQFTEAPEEEDVETGAVLVDSDGKRTFV